jgi:hypothetical protein
VVHGRISDGKTEYSEDLLPLDSAFAEVMLDCRNGVQRGKGTGSFPNPNAGKLFHASPIQQDYIRPAGRKAKFEKDIGWHTFWHAYRSFLDAAGAPVGGPAEANASRSSEHNHEHLRQRTDAIEAEANTKVIQAVLPPKKRLTVAV